IPGRVRLGHDRHQRPAARRARHGSDDRLVYRRAPASQRSVHGPHPGRARVMFTGTLAMLHRAVRLDARLLRTHLFRAGFAWLVYVSLLYALWISQTLLGAPGLRMFEAMTWLNVVLISLAGVSFFATAITEEKEEDTLGLLKMAGIDPLGILLGK